MLTKKKKQMPIVEICELKSRKLVVQIDLLKLISAFDSRLYDVKLLTYDVLTGFVIAVVFELN